jgi:hypothetical protein
MTDDVVDGRPSGCLTGDEHGDGTQDEHGDGAERDSQDRSVRILHVDDDELNRALVRWPGCAICSSRSFTGRHSQPVAPSTVLSSPLADPAARQQPMFQHI